MESTGGPWACPLMRLRLIGGSGLFDRSSRGVHDVFKFFAGLEVRNLLGRDFNPRSGLGIAPDAGLALTRPEAAEAADLDLIAATQGFHDAVEDRLDDD